MQVRVTNFYGSISEKFINSVVLQKDSLSIVFINYLGSFCHPEISTDCENDYVAIYEGPRLNKLIGKYCGRQAPPAIIFAANEKIRIEFHTDGEAGFEGPTGFAAKFHKAPRKLTDSGLNITRNLSNRFFKANNLMILKIFV